MTTVPDPAGPAPADVAVIMCRGASRRFGAPKALATVGDDPRPLLQRVAATYERTGLGLLLVVTTPGLVRGCGECLADGGGPPFAVAVGDGGGGTALTLAFAWQWLRDAGREVARVWVHPVDLPRVGRRTLAQLARVSADAGTRPVRPSWGRQPGHPLVMPGRLLEQLAPAASRSASSWREFYECEAAAGRAPAVVEVPVADPGVVLDHDEPGEATATDREG